jgi:hypothetical protein
LPAYIERLCNGFSLLEERDQEYIFGVLQALLFAKKRAEKTIVSDFRLWKRERVQCGCISAKDNIKEQVK